MTFRPPIRFTPEAGPARLTAVAGACALALAGLTSTPAHSADAPEGQASSAAAPEGSLPSVTVTGVRAEGYRPQTVEAGTFRGSDVMEVPSTVNVVTRDVLEAQAASGLYDALRNTAGVTRQQNGGETWDQLVIRGMAVENRTNYRLNGSLPVLNFSQVPVENKERIEVLKGASALYYGFTSPAGIVNLVTKRPAKEPVTRVGTSFNNWGGAQATVDLSRRFGEDQQLGLRVNAAGGRLGSYLSGASDGQRGFASLAMDWRVNSRLTLKADVEHDRRRVIEQAGIQLPPAVKGVITLPHPVDPKALVGPDWSKFRTSTTNALLRADVSLSQNWALTLEGGRSSVDRHRELAIFRFNDAASVLTGAGNVRGTSQDSSLRSDMVRAELAGLLTTGFVSHELTLGVSATRKSQAPIYQRIYAAASQNLYSPMDVSDAITWSAAPTKPTTAGYKTRENAVYAIDRMRFGDQWQLIAGVRHTRYRSDQGALQYAPNQTTPMAAVVYQPRADLSFYLSMARGLEEGETAPAGTANESTRMRPGVSKQREIGARWLAPNGTLLSAAVFDIQRPGYYTNSQNTFVASGKQKYSGVEVAAQGQLTRQLAWMASAQWLNPRFADIGPAYDGRLPENASRKTASLFLEYALPSAPGLSVNAGAFYTGRRPVDDLNRAFLGGVTLFSAGARYSTKVAGRGVHLQLQVDNLADKRYWAGAGTRLAAGAPRSFKAKVAVDL